MIVGIFMIAAGLTLLDSHCQGFIRYGLEKQEEYKRKTKPDTSADPTRAWLQDDGDTVNSVEEDIQV